MPNKLLKQDYVGKKYGRLTVIDVIWENQKCFFICKCDCGKIKKHYYYTVTSGSAKSCGCYRGEVLKNLLSLSCDKNVYNIWKAMKQRCSNPSCTAYKNYGMRGIKICEDWNTYDSFSNWANTNGYKKGLTIDRIDNDGDYCPQNCRFVDMKTQANNRRITVYYTINGKTKSLSEWCDEYGLSYLLVWQRVHTLGWNIEKALSTQSRKTKNFKQDLQLK